ncbi:MAG: hypothetical protein ACE37H_06600 [Phycisphaeraceae bacterium]
MNDPTPIQREVFEAGRIVSLPVLNAELDAPTTPEPAPDKTPPRHALAEIGGLRFVIVAWCFWLLGAWAIAWLSDTSVPRVRWMLFAGSFGLMLVWPAFRLSQRSEPGDLTSSAVVVLLDWLAMVTVYQAVIWSLHLIAGWPLARGAWLDAAIVSWSLMSALIVAVARLWPGAWARLLGMWLCIALVFAEPAGVWLSQLGGGAGWPMRVSPVQVLWELTDPPRTQRVEQWGRPILMVGLTALVGWLSLGVWAVGAKLTARGGKR